MNLKEATLNKLLARKQQFRSELKELKEKDEWLISNDGTCITFEAAEDCIYAVIEDIEKEILVRKATEFHSL